jgi:hypothetical protein
MSLSRFASSANTISRTPEFKRKLIVSVSVSISGRRIGEGKSGRVVMR